MPRFTCFALAACFVSVAMAPSQARAQASSYPSKPIKIVVPYAPGGTADLIVRALITSLGDQLGQPLVADYKPGATTMLASSFVANAPKDGYTLAIVTKAVTNVFQTHRSVPYRLSDLAPVSMFVFAPYAMSVHKGLPVDKPLQFVEYARANAGKINYATLGVGGSPHIMGKRLEEVSGIRMVDVPYKGGGPALTDLISGQVHLYFDGIPSSLAQYKAGNIKILGFTSEERLPAAPEIPTLKEQGLNLVSGGWYGVMAPRGTPQDIIDRLNREIQKAVATPEFKTRLIAAGAIGVSSPSAAAFGKVIEDETRDFAKTVERLGLKPE